jgi:uncharacterized protein
LKQRNRVVALLTTLVAGYTALCVAVAWRQTSLIFFPTREVRLTPTDVALPYEEWSLHTGDGATLHAWKIPPAAEPKFWVVHCHGNGGNISHRLDVARLFHSVGVGVVLFDYRGYGRSQGELRNEAQLLQDGQAVYDRVAALGKPVILYGESLGGGVAAALAEKNPYAGLVLQSTFTRLTDRAAELYPFLPIRWLSRFRLATVDRLPKLHGPVLVMHSSEDEIIPAHHGQRLHAAAPEPKLWKQLRGGHNELDGESWTAAMREFLELLAP